MRAIFHAAAGCLAAGWSRKPLDGAEAGGGGGKPKAKKGAKPAAAGKRPRGRPPKQAPGGQQEDGEELQEEENPGAAVNADGRACQVPPVGGGAAARKLEAPVAGSERLAQAEGAAGAAGRKRRKV